MMSPSTLPAATPAPLPTPVPPVDPREILTRLRGLLMTLLVAGPETQIGHMIAVERLCQLGRDAAPGDNEMAAALATIASRAPVIAGLTLAPEGVRERSFSDCVKLVTGLSARPRLREAA